ncbi:MAG: SRPBCC family protein [Actinomycetota bacterium]
MQNEATSIDIASPATTVFAYVADFTNDPEWRSEVSDSRRAGGSLDEVGATYEQTLDVAGREIHTTFAVTELVPPHVVSFEGGSGPVDVGGSIVLTPVADDETRLTFQHHMSGPWWFRVLAPWLARRRSRGIDRDLEQLKRHLESATA